MSDNKNNTLKDDIEKRKNPRPHRKRNNKKVEHRDDSKANENLGCSLDNFLDIIGATNGVTIITNGDKNGSSQVPTSSFVNMLKQLVVDMNNEPKTSADIDDDCFANSFIEDDWDCELEDADWEDDDDWEDELGDALRDIIGPDVEVCPQIESVIKSLLQTRPFGIDWDIDKVINFLKENGYKIYKKRDKINNSEYMVAYKEGVTKPVNDIRLTNLGKEFSSTIQDILLRWLTKIK